MMVLIRPDRNSARCGTTLLHLQDGYQAWFDDLLDSLLESAPAQQAIATLDLATLESVELAPVPAGLSKPAARTLRSSSPDLAARRPWDRYDADRIPHGHCRTGPTTPGRQGCPRQRHRRRVGERRQLGPGAPSVTLHCISAYRRPPTKRNRSQRPAKASPRVGVGFRYPHVLHIYAIKCTPDRHSGSFLTAVLSDTDCTFGGPCTRQPTYATLCLVATQILILIVARFSS